MAYLLPHDLIIQIFSWLPPKDLIRLRTLSKLWYSTIADPKFIQLHLSHFGNPRRNDTAGLILIPSYDASTAGVRQIDLFSESNVSLISIEQVDNSNTRGTWKFSGSCNGLICYYKDDKNWFKIPSPIVWNPSIRRAISLPALNYPFPCPFGEIFGMLTYGIGFDPIEEDYKILVMRNRLTTMKPNWNPYSTVYSLKSKLWKRVEALIPQGFAFGHSIFLNGSIHWLFHSITRGKESILAYDVHNEVFKEMSLPNKVFKEMPLHYRLSVVKGSLCVMIEAWGLDDYPPREVWIMKEYGVIGSWTLQFHNVLLVMRNKINAATVGGKIPCYDALASDGGSSVEAHRPYRLTLFDPQTNKFTPVCRRRWGDEVYSVVRSIESLNFLNECDQFSV